MFYQWDTQLWVNVGMGMFYQWDTQVIVISSEGCHIKRDVYHFKHTKDRVQQMAFEIQEISKNDHNIIKTGICDGLIL